MKEAKAMTMAESKKPIIPKKRWDKDASAFIGKFITPEGSPSKLKKGVNGLINGLIDNASRTIKSEVCKDTVEWLISKDKECFNVEEINVLLKHVGELRAENLIVHPSFIRVSARMGAVFYMDSKGNVRRQSIKGGAPKVGAMVIDGEIDPNFYLVPRWYKTLKEFIAAGRTVLMIGPAGTGKSEAVEQLFVERGQRLLIVSCNPSQTADDLEGVTNLVETPVGMKTEFSPAKPAIALKEGFGLLLDEADTIPPESCYSLYRVIDGRSMEILRQGYDGSIIRHDNFRVMGTQNTEGRGDAAGLFHGRAFQDEAFLDRWDCFIRVGYPNMDEEKLIVHKRTGLPSRHADNVVKAADLMRNALEAEKIMTSVSLRRTIAVSKNLVNGFSPEDAWSYSVLNRATPEDSAALLQILQRVYGGKLESPLEVV